ncbi:MAG: transporter substrate-binding domain-containing protein, partial [Methanocorpusculaceae archaeon]|nr:transporter substrate-binding domain-containing protein [Methanocorpusculaceae archaeon]
GSPLTAQFNDALAALKADGTLAQIIENYIGDDDVKGTMPYVKKDVERKGTLVMATNAYFPPYEYYAGGDIVGIDADIAQAICDELGYELEIKDMEFDAIIPAIASGKADFGAAGMTVTEDRLKNVDFTDSYATAKQVIIVKNPEAAASPAPIAGLLAGLGAAALALRRL